MAAAGYPADAAAAPAAKTKARMTYAVELECDEADTRHYMHPWCVDSNESKCASMPAMLEGEKKANIPNMFKVAAAKFADKNCMGTRAIEHCKIEGKKQFWKKGPPQWAKYSEVYQNVEHGAKGLVGLAGIKELRKDKKSHCSNFGRYLGRVADISPGLLQSGNARHHRLHYSRPRSHDSWFERDRVRCSFLGLVPVQHLERSSSLEVSEFEAHRFDWQMLRAACQ